MRFREITETKNLIQARSIFMIDGRVDEARVLQVEPYGKFGGTVRVWENPTHREVVELLKRYDFRGLVTSKNCFLWDANDAVHSQMERLLNFDAQREPYAPIVVTTEDGDFRAFNYWNDYDSVRRNGIAVMTQDGLDDPAWKWPAMTRLLGPAE
jgi:hypothetical protein